MFKVLKFLLISISLVGCSPMKNNDKVYIKEIPNETNEVNIEDALEIQAKTMASYMDTTVDPCEDFYQYACGNFEKMHPIPEDKSSNTVFGIMSEKLMNIKLSLLENVDQNEEDENLSSLLKKSTSFYAACMDQEKLKEFGSEPIFNYYESLGGWELFNQIARENRTWTDISTKIAKSSFTSMLPIRLAIDLMNPSEYILSMDQTPLRILSRQDFLNEGENKLMVAYKEYMETILTLLGISDEVAKQTVTDIVNFEIEIAKLTTDTLERKDITKLYNRMSIAELQENIPGIDWLNYIQELEYSVNETTEIVLYATEFMPKFIELIANTNPKTVENYIFMGPSLFLVENLDERFEENERKLMEAISGKPKVTPRWKTCLSLTDSVIENAISILFIRTYFNNESKNDVYQLAKHLQDAFKEVLKETEWIDEETKILALKKLDAVDLQLGYSEDFFDLEKLNDKYKDLEISKDSYFQNVLSVRKTRLNNSKKRFGTKVDPKEWVFDPITINAYYAPSTNTLVFPAALLQPPLYNRIFPNALNYGGIGTFIGHEITHAFGEAGRTFDDKGVMNLWFSPSSVEQYNKREECFKEQYSNYTIFGYKINGNASSDENVADNSGLYIAFRAYKIWMQQIRNMFDVVEPERVSGIDLNDDQLFFLSYAQLWCGSFRQESVIRQITTDEHCPYPIRVRGSVSNSRAFSEAYNCPVGAEMNPVNRCSMW